MTCTWYFVNRSDPARSYADQNVIWQPLRNGDSGNLALDILGLPMIPGSTLRPLLPSVTSNVIAVSAGPVVTLEWSAAARGFAVESASSLGADAVWIPLTNAVTTNVNAYRFSVPMEAGTRFFRLRK